MFLRACVGVFFVGLAGFLAHRVGVAVSIVLSSVTAAAICSGVAWLLHHAPMGRVSPINRLAPVVLPLGFNIGHGKLWPVVVCSWLGWTIVAGVAAFHAVTHFRLLGRAAVGHGHVLHFAMMAILLVDAVGFSYLTQLAAKRLKLRSPGLVAMATVLSIIAGSMIGAILVWNAGWPTLGTFLAAGPPLVVGGFYGLFFLVTRNQRFN